MICLSGYGEVGTLQSLACLAIENLVRKSLDQVGLGRGGQDGRDDHDDVTDIGDDGNGDDFNNGDGDGDDDYCKDGVDDGA